jgi:hypothetical protein
MRQQTFILVSPYMDKGGGYELFRSRWRFGWETVNVPEFEPLTEEEIEAIKTRHMKYLKPKQ